MGKGRQRQTTTSAYVCIESGFQGGNLHLKVGGAKSSGNAGDPMLGVTVSGGYNHPNHKVGGGQK